MFSWFLRPDNRPGYIGAVLCGHSPKVSQILSAVCRLFDILNSMYGVNRGPNPLYTLCAKQCILFHIYRPINTMREVVAQSVWLNQLLNNVSVRSKFLTCVWLKYWRTREWCGVYDGFPPPPSPYYRTISVAKVSHRNS